MTRWHNSERGQRDATRCKTLMWEEATWERDSVHHYYTALDLLVWFQKMYPRIGVSPSHAYQIALDVVGKL